MLSIKKRYERLLKKEAEIADKITALQEECPHIGHSIVYKSDTGNWDPSEDCYWTENKCHNCGKFWMAAQ